LIKLAGYALQNVEREICASFHHRERIAHQRLYGEDIDEVKRERLLLDGHRLFLMKITLWPQ
jgi:hypothetical protein